MEVREPDEILTKMVENRLDMTELAKFIHKADEDVNVEQELSEYNRLREQVKALEWVLKESDKIE